MSVCIYIYIYIYIYTTDNHVFRHVCVCACVCVVACLYMCIILIYIWQIPLHKTPLLLDTPPFSSPGKIWSSVCSSLNINDQESMVVWSSIFVDSFCCLVPFVVCWFLLLFVGLLCWWTSIIGHRCSIISSIIFSGVLPLFTQQNMLSQHRWLSVDARLYAQSYFARSVFSSLP